MRTAGALAGLAILLAACSASPFAGSDDTVPAALIHVDCCGKVSAPAPDGSKTVIFDPDEAEVIHIRLSAGWLKQTDLGTAGVSTSASWAPGAQAFFLNDGEGSGQHSTFRLFNTPDDGATRETDRPYHEAIGAYRSSRGCSALHNTEVWGIGWSKDGRLVHLLVQAAIHDPCGSADRFMVMTARVSDGQIVARYETAEAKQRFHALIPPNVMAESAVTAP